MTNQWGLYQSGDFTYDFLNETEIKIKRYTGTDPFPIIPNKIDGRPVTVLGKKSFAGTYVREISVPEGIRSIEENAFAFCEDLVLVTLPCSLSTMGRGVFQASESLSEISLSGKSTNYAVVENILYDRNECRVVFSPPAQDLEVIQIPYGTDTISDSAFYCNRKLKYVVLPKTLQTIERGAFLFTDSLKMIELPPFLKEIEDGAFLVGNGPHAEKSFTIYAFPDTVGYQYAKKNGIRVEPLYFHVSG